MSLLDILNPVWLHTAKQEAETVSMCSSESLADQGYAASEGMADSPLTSPEDTVSLGPDPSLSPTLPQEDCDSDEGCATWDSRHRYLMLTRSPKLRSWFYLKVHMVACLTFDSRAQKWRRAASQGRLQGKKKRWVKLLSFMSSIAFTPFSQMAQVAYHKKSISPKLSHSCSFWDLYT